VNDTDKKENDQLKKHLLGLLLGDVTIDDNKKTIKANKNNLPLAFYVGVGGRALITLDGNTKTKKFDNETEAAIKEKDNNENARWAKEEDPSAKFTTKTDINGVKRLTKKSIKDFNKTSHNTLLNTYKGFKRVSTHGIKNGKETKVLFNWFSRVTSMGHNVAIDPAKPADGVNGHMSIIIKDNQALIGLENSAPGKKGHSLTGGSQKVSALGSPKAKDLEISKSLDPNLASIVIPNKFNGLKVDLSSDKLKWIEENYEKITPKIFQQIINTRAGALQDKNIEDLNKLLENELKDFSALLHNNKYEKTKPFIVKPLEIAKANKPWKIFKLFNKNYSKQKEEYDAYKVYKKTQKAYDKLPDDLKKNLTVTENHEFNNYDNQTRSHSQNQTKATNQLVNQGAVQTRSLSQVEGDKRRESLTTQNTYNLTSYLNNKKGPEKTNNRSLGG
jgi:hypothetical protein